MGDSGKNGRKHFFSMQSVDFDDDAAIEAFGRQVWQEVARREEVEIPSVRADSSAVQAEEQQE